MTIESNSSLPSSSLTPETMSHHDLPPDLPDDISDNDLATSGVVTQTDLAKMPQGDSSKTPETLDSARHDSALPQAIAMSQRAAVSNTTAKPSVSLTILAAIAVIFLGLALNNLLIGLSGTLLALVLSLAVLWPWLQAVAVEVVSPSSRSLIVAVMGVIAAFVGLFKFTGVNRRILTWASELNWGAIGALGEVIGAVGQILIAIVAVYVAWRQYVISKDLTIQQNLLTVQQNLITQQQTIDTYFQGVSDLVLDDQGLLEDWPQERAIAEGRTAAILSSVDASGKAKILRFLSHSRLLTPLKRDQRLGRAILDGTGGYAEDRLYGVRVIDLRAMLAGADLSGTDLRGTDFSEANLANTNLSHCDLGKTNLTLAVLYSAKLIEADLKGSLLFYGSSETATPRSRTEVPNYKTGAHTGAIVENADFSNVRRLSEPARYYCCAWGGEKTRTTIPGGCEGTPNKLGR